MPVLVDAEHGRYGNDEMAVGPVRDEAAAAAAAAAAEERGLSGKGSGAYELPEVCHLRHPF